MLHRELGCRIGGVEGMELVCVEGWDREGGVDRDGGVGYARRG